MKFKDFSYSPHNLSSETLFKIQGLLGMDFPDAFVGFLMRYNGVLLPFPENYKPNEPLMVFLKVDEKIYPVDKVLTVTEFIYDPLSEDSLTPNAKKSPFLHSYLLANFLEGYLDRTMVAFARDGSDSLFCISLSKHDYGHIYHVQGATEGCHAPLRVCTSINDFADNLHFEAEKVIFEKYTDYLS